ncbi:polysaccharide deacetylase family protein [Bacillus sp. 1P06AnD]|uniref:polysaccharide deacetylase family protein n=1 Tax=Bacillus sp. 1P06AnD TaxID=3132208 RepID=UPI0039A26B2B
MKKKNMLTILLITLLISGFPQTTVKADELSRQEYEMKGDVVWEGKTTKKMVALTFDDGPHELYTGQILDILAKHRMKATFFVSGSKIERHPEVLYRVFKEGHEIGNHTYNHIYNKHITSGKLEKELLDTERIIQKVTGQKPTLYRPVGGLFNNRMIETAVKNGYKVVLWSWHQDPKDWRSPGADRIANHIIKNIRPGDIILLHDWRQNAQTVKAMEKVADFLDQEEYQCVTVSEMIYQSDPSQPKTFFSPES